MWLLGVLSVLFGLFLLGVGSILVRILSAINSAPVKSLQKMWGPDGLLNAIELVEIMPEDGQDRCAHPRIHAATNGLRQNLVFFEAPGSLAVLRPALSDK